MDGTTKELSSLFLPLDKRDGSAHPRLQIALMEEQDTSIISLKVQPFFFILHYQPRVERRWSRAGEERSDTLYSK